MNLKEQLDTAAQSPDCHPVCRYHWAYFSKISDTQWRVQLDGEDFWRVLEPQGVGPVAGYCAAHIAIFQELVDGLKVVFSHKIGGEK